MLTIPPLEKIISRSRSSKMRNTNAITNSSSSVTSIETRADRNGDALVYHRSDCGYPRHRVYGDGGNWPGSVCGNWIPEFGAIPLCGVNINAHDVIWYGEYDDDLSISSVRNTYTNIKIRNEDGGGRHNWTPKEIDNVITTMVDLEYPCR